MIPTIKILKGHLTSDGAGVKLTRFFGPSKYSIMDPFLLLDEFKSDDRDDYIAGFPPHPHRGFETITYLKYGEFEHRDSKGNHGLLKEGSVQWMTAGRGIIHSEMPKMKEGLLWGYQLWLNLGKNDKMTRAAYQEYHHHEFPIYKENNISIKIIAGEHAGLKSPIHTRFAVEYFDITIMNSAELSLFCKEYFSSMILLYAGEIRVNDQLYQAGDLLVLPENNRLLIHADKDAGFLFLSGQRLNEAIAAYGPFVMNTDNEIMTAIKDYENGRLDADE